MDQNLIPEIWSHLPVELVFQIVENWVDGALDACETYPLWLQNARFRRFWARYGVYRADNREEDRATRGLLTAAAVLRDDSDLYRIRRPQVERYFLDEWLNTVVFLAPVNPARGYYYRYFCVPPTQPHDAHTNPTCTAQIDGKAIFFLNPDIIYVDNYGATASIFGVPPCEETFEHPIGVPPPDMEALLQF